MALPPRKAWAEYVVCKEEQCFKLPINMTYNDAVAITLDGMVAYSMLFEMGGLKIEDPSGLRTRRKTVLMHSSAGGLVRVAPVQTGYRVLIYFNCRATW